MADNQFGTLVLLERNLFGLRPQGLLSNNTVLFTNYLILQNTVASAATLSAKVSDQHALIMVNVRKRIVNSGFGLDQRRCICGLRLLHDKVIDVCPDLTMPCQTHANELLLTTQVNGLHPCRVLKHQYTY